jgi:hypothetical protein
MNRPSLEVADLVRAAGRVFIERSRRWITWQHLTVLRAIARCRTAAWGGHPPLRLPRQPPAYRSPAALRSTTRPRTAIAIQTNRRAGQAHEPTLALSPMWRPQGGPRETDCCPVPTPFSPLSHRSRAMKLPFRSRSLGASHHLQPWCALLVPHQAPGWKLSHANYNRSTPACAPVSSITDSPSLSHHGNTIEFA